MWHLCDDTRVAQVGNRAILSGMAALWHSVELFFRLNVWCQMAAWGMCHLCHATRLAQVRMGKSLLALIATCVTPAAHTACFKGAGTLLTCAYILAHRLASGLCWRRKPTFYQKIRNCLLTNMICPILSWMRFKITGERAPGAGAASLHPVLHTSRAQAPPWLPGQGAGGAGSGEGGSTGGGSCGQRGGRRREGGRGGGLRGLGEAAARQPGKAVGGATADTTAGNSASNHQQARDDQDS